MSAPTQPIPPQSSSSVATMNLYFKHVPVSLGKLLEFASNVSGRTRVQFLCDAIEREARSTMPSDVFDHIATQAHAQSQPTPDMQSTQPDVRSTSEE